MKRLLVILCCSFSSLLFAQNEALDSLRELAAQSSGATQAKLFADLAWEFARYDDSIALDYAQQARAYYLAQQKDTALSEMLHIMGFIHVRSGRPDSAIQYYLSSVEISERLPYPRGLRSTYNHLGVLHKNLGQYDKALEYLDKTYQLSMEAKDSIDLGIALNSIGTIYYRQKRLNEALETHLKALAIREHLGNARWIASSLGSIGNAYSELGEPQQALNYYQRSLEKFRETGDRYNIGNSYVNLASTHAELGDLALAETYIKKGEAYSDSLSDIHLKETALSVWVELYELKGDFAKAFEYQKAHQAVRDSIVNLETNERIGELEVRYETEKKEQQIKFQALTLKEQEGQLDLRRRTNIALVLLLLVIVVLSLAIYQRIRRKKERELQQAIIQEQEKGLEAVIHAQEEERKRIAKDLHDGIGQQLSGVKMAFQKISRQLSKEDPSNTEELQKLEAIVSDSAAEVRTISHQMMPRVLLEIGLIAAIEDMLAKSLGMLDLTYEFEHFGIEERLAERIEISLYRICQELVNNIIKHSQATHVQVQLFKNKGKIIFIVEDNGKGIDPDKESGGHGLMNIRSRLNTINGEVNYAPSPNSGTVATIRISLE